MTDTHEHQSMPETLCVDDEFTRQSDAGNYEINKNESQSGEAYRRWPSRICDYIDGW